MTSANVSEYIIRDKDGKQVDSHSQHCMCKTHWAELLRFVPLEDYTIQRTWEDEEEEYHEYKVQNLRDFMTTWATSLIRHINIHVNRGTISLEDAIKREIEREFFSKDAEAHKQRAYEFIKKLIDNPSQTL